MLAELIITYALITNEPVLLQSSGPPYARHEVELKVEKEFLVGSVAWGGGRYLKGFLKIQPYVQGSERNSVERAGAFAEVGIHFGDVDISLYHHSSHNLDRPGDALEVDGIRVRVRLD